MILNHRQEQFGIDKLMPKYKKATNVEIKIYEARDTGISVSDLLSDHLRADVQNALIRISVICGSPLPEKHFFAQMLIEETIILLLDFGYEDYTIAELILAARINCKCNLKYPSGSDAQHVEIIGTTLCVDYISQILNIYKTFRTIFDNQLKNLIDGY